MCNTPYTICISISRWEELELIWYPGEISMIWLMIIYPGVVISTTFAYPNKMRAAWRAQPYHLHGTWSYILLRLRWGQHGGHSPTTCMEHGAISYWGWDEGSMAGTALPPAWNMVLDILLRLRWGQHGGHSPTTCMEHGTISYWGWDEGSMEGTALYHLHGIWS